MLSFQKLDVYRDAIKFLALSAKLPATLPKGHSRLADQLRRAAMSVPRHIAEAASRASDADAATHYAIALDSAMECAVIVDAMLVLSVVDPMEHAQPVELLGQIVEMLTVLASDARANAAEKTVRVFRPNAPPRASLPMKRVAGPITGAVIVGAMVALGGTYLFSTRTSAPHGEASPSASMVATAAVAPPPPVGDNAASANGAKPAEPSASASAAAPERPRPLYRPRTTAAAPTVRRLPGSGL